MTHFEKRMIVNSQAVFWLWSLQNLVHTVMKIENGTPIVDKDYKNGGTLIQKIP